MKCYYKLCNTDESVIEIESELAIIYSSHINYNNKRYFVVSVNTMANGDWIVKAQEIVLGSISETFRHRFRKFLKNNAIEANADEMSEELATSIFCKFFEKDFYIERNISGKHFSNKRQNIDLVLIPKDTSKLKNKNLVFGVEMKNPFLDRSKGRKNSDIMAQCLDYAQSDFEKYPDMIVLICPIPPRYESEKVLLNFISRYNVGYVTFSERNLTFNLAELVIWSSDYGFGSLLKNSLMKRKIGNRAYKIK